MRVPNSAVRCATAYDTTPNSPVRRQHQREDREAAQHADDHVVARRRRARAPRRTSADIRSAPRRHGAATTERTLDVSAAGSRRFDRRRSSGASPDRIGIQTRGGRQFGAIGIGDVGRRRQPPDALDRAARPASIETCRPIALIDAAEIPPRRLVSLITATSRRALVPPRPPRSSRRPSVAAGVVRRAPVTTAVGSRVVRRATARRRWSSAIGP